MKSTFWKIVVAGALSVALGFALVVPIRVGDNLTREALRYHRSRERTRAVRIIDDMINEITNRYTPPVAMPINVACRVSGLQIARDAIAEGD